MSSSGEADGSVSEADGSVSRSHRDVETGPERTRSVARARDGSPATDVERSAFTAGFPPDPELAELVAAFDRGDYAFVRDRAPALAARTGRADVRDAALELRARIDPDPTSRALLLVAIALFVALAGHYLLHGSGGGR